MIRVCFVCLGNICRSPTAEGVMLALVERAGLADSIEVDSAGTAAYHVGEPADARSAAAAAERGYELPSRARQFLASDFAKFDYVLAMDTENQQGIEQLARTGEQRAKIYLFRSLDETAPEGASVPDPYYGGPRGFEDVVDICERGCEGLLAHIRAEHDL